MKMIDIGSMSEKEK